MAGRASSRLRRRRVAYLFALAAGTAVLAATGSVSLAAPPSAQFTGRYVLVHADGPHVLGNDRLDFIEVGGRLYELHGLARPLPPNATIRVQGALAGTVLTADGPAAVQVVSTPSAVPAAPSPTQTLLAIDVVWGTQTIDTTQATATNFLFGTTDPQRRTLRQYYQDISYGQIDWTGAVTPTLTIPDPGSCALGTIADAADAAATSAGYVLSNYGHRMYDFPAQYCGQDRAWGEVGGPRSWISNGLANLSDGYKRMGPSHEVGHNFGLWHGHGLDCGASQPTATCVSGATNHRCDDGWAAPCVSEYGFSYDLMGNDWTSDNFDAVNWLSLDEEMILGWVNGRTLADADPGVDADHTFTIAPIESAAGNVGLVITSGSRHYFVEYRQPLGQDFFLTNWPDATSGVLISSDDDVNSAVDVSPPGTPGPLNLDTSPGSCVSDTYCDWHDAALNAGQTFTDIGGLFTLTLGSATSTGATVTVHWNSHGATAPSAPTNVVATAGDAAATVSWTAPASNGGSPVTGYTVTSSPGGITAAAGGSATTAVVPGLTNGVGYTFTVVATNAAGSSPPSAPSNTVTPAPATTVASAFPGSVGVTTGSAAGGGAASLAADDGSYFAVASTTTRKKKTAWYAIFAGVPASLSSLKVTYSGANTLKCSQTISIYQWSTAAWVSLDSRPVGPTKVLVAGLSPAGSPGAYVNGSGQVAIQVGCITKTGAFTADGDLLTIAYAP